LKLGGKNFTQRP